MYRRTYLIITTGFTKYDLSQLNGKIRNNSWSIMVAASRAWSLVARGRASLLALAPRFSSSAFLPIGIDFASCSTNSGNCKLPSFIPVPGGWAAGADFTVPEKWLLFIRWKNFGSICKVFLAVGAKRQGFWTSEASPSTWLVLIFIL